VIKATPGTHGFSVDVVDMSDCIGPHHVHPNGEIDLIMDTRIGWHGVNWSLGRVWRCQPWLRCSYASRTHLLASVSSSPSSSSVSRRSICALRRDLSAV
jgi:hypothetical protein